MELKLKQCVSLHNLLNPAKLTKVDDVDKFKLIKLMKELKLIVQPYEDFEKDAKERLKPENFDKILENAQKWQREGAETTLTDDEKIEVNTVLGKYERDVTECLTDELNKSVTLSIEAFSEDAINKLIASNDTWTIGSCYELLSVLA